MSPLRNHRIFYGIALRPKSQLEWQLCSLLSESSPHPSPSPSTSSLLARGRFGRTNGMARSRHSLNQQLIFPFSFFVLQTKFCYLKTI